jgi:hypothetical protein
VLSPWGLLAFGGLRSGLVDERTGLEERVWRMDLWSWRWLPITTDDVTIGTGPVQAHKHREEGQLSGRGDVFPAVFEEVPSVARFLTAAALVGEYAGKVVDETGYAVPMEHEWPAIYTFGGDDTARTFNGDLRRLELHGLAAEYASSPSASTASSPDDGSTSSGVFDPEAKRHERCDWRLYSNSTADRLWEANCMASSYAIFDSPTCTLRDILQRAWCTQEFQSISYL